MSTRQIHTVLGGGIRYETAELVLSTIPNFELKQKGRILHLFSEIYNAFIQEIQEALDERQNNLDSLLTHNQANIPFAEPFAFESQIDTDTYPVDLSTRSVDEPSHLPQESETTTSNETVPLLTVPNEKRQSDTHQCHRQKSTWISTKDPINIKKEPITPPKTKRRQSKTSSNAKQRKQPSLPPMRQTTMTQLFDPIESPQSPTEHLTSIKREPQSPIDDTVLFMPESLIGLAQPSESMSDHENDQNISLDPLSLISEIKKSDAQSCKRKSMLSPTLNDNTTSDNTDQEEGEEDIQNEALLQSPYAGVDPEELLYACPMCRNYWLGLPEELRHKQGLTCRHRQRPVARTPEHFWSLGIPSTQTCIERGYGGVLPPDKPIQRPRRPRRQHQQKLREQQQNNDIDDDEEL